MNAAAAGSGASTDLLRYRSLTPYKRLPPAESRMIDILKHCQNEVPAFAFYQLVSSNTAHLFLQKKESFQELAGSDIAVPKLVESNDDLSSNRLCFYPYKISQELVHPSLF